MARRSTKKRSEPSWSSADALTARLQDCPLRRGGVGHVEVHMPLALELIGFLGADGPITAAIGVDIRSVFERAAFRGGRHLQGARRQRAGRGRHGTGPHHHLRHEQADVAE